MLRIAIASAVAIGFVSPGAADDRPGAKTAGGECASFDRTYPNGATIGCTVRPRAGGGCPLGLPGSYWNCRDGSWVYVPR